MGQSSESAGEVIREAPALLQQQVAVLWLQLQRTNSCCRRIGRGVEQDRRLCPTTQTTAHPPSMPWADRDEVPGHNVTNNHCAKERVRYGVAVAVVTLAVVAVARVDGVGRAEAVAHHPRHLCVE